MDSMQKIEATIAEFQARFVEIQKEAQITMGEVFQQLFEDNPELTGIWFAGGTPSFNDGEPCVFTLHDVYVQTGELAESYDDAGNMDAEQVSSTYHGPHRGVAMVVEKMLNKMDSIGIIEKLFDSYGFAACVTREGIQTFEYYVGY